MSGTFDYNTDGYTPPTPHTEPGQTHGGGNADSLALASLVSGIATVVSLACCCIPLVNYMAMVVNPLLMIVAFIAGGLALQDKSLSNDKKVYAQLGLAAGLINLVFIAVLVVVMMVGLGGAVLFPQLLSDLPAQ